MSNNSLTEIIEQAMSGEGVKNEESSTETSTSTETAQSKEQTEEPVVEPAKTETPQEPKKEDFSEEELATAKNLFKALKNPDTAKVTIDFLAQSLGLTGTETKQEIREVKKSIVQTLEESLGEELAFLGPKLAPVLEKFISDAVEEKIKPIRQAQELTQDEKLQDESSAVITSIAKEFFDSAEIPSEIESRMSDLMDKFQPSAKMTPKDYISSIFHMVAGEKGLVKKTPSIKDTAQRITKAINSPIGKLAKSGSETIVPGSKKMTLNESIAHAIQAQEG